MQTLERNIVSNGRSTVLREKIIGALDALALLKKQIEGLDEGKQIAASLENIRASVIKADPTLIWQRSTPNFVIARSPAKQDDEAIPTERLPRLSEARNDILANGQQENQVEKQALQKAVRRDSGVVADAPPQNDEIKNLGQALKEEPRLSTASEIVLVNDLGAEEGTEVEEEIDSEDIDERKMENVSELSLHIRDIERFPIQREKHTRWAEEILVGELALKRLSKLLESEFLEPSQKEKVLEALSRGKFLIRRLDSRTRSLEKRIKEDKYENGQDRKLDREFIERVLANEYLVIEVLGGTIRGIEDEGEREAILDQFIKRQINFVNQGLESWNNLVTGNLRLAVSIAKRYQYRGVDLPDLIGYGQEGLVIAAADFDSKKGNQFSTYATWWIKQKITRAIIDYAPMIRLPVHVHDEINRGIRAQEQDLQEGRQSDLPDKLHNFLKLRTVSSLDEPTTDEGDRTLGDTIANNGDQDVEDIAEKSSLADVVKELLLTLDDRKRRVLELRFGINDGRPRTLEEVGRELGVTRERIRQIEAIALRKLRHPSRARKLRSFI